MHVKIHAIFFCCSKRIRQFAQFAFDGGFVDF